MGDGKLGLLVVAACRLPIRACVCYSLTPIPSFVWYEFAFFFLQQTRKSTLPDGESHLHPCRSAVTLAALAEPPLPVAQAETSPLPRIVSEVEKPLLKAADISESLNRMENAFDTSCSEAEGLRRQLLAIGSQEAVDAALSMILSDPVLHQNLCRYHEKIYDGVQAIEQARDLEAALLEAANTKDTKPAAMTGTIKGSQKCWPGWAGDLAKDLEEKYEGTPWPGHAELMNMIGTKMGDADWTTTDLTKLILKQGHRIKQLVQSKPKAAEQLRRMLSGMRSKHEGLSRPKMLVLMHELREWASMV